MSRETDQEIIEQYEEAMEELRATKYMCIIFVVFWTIVITCMFFFLDASLENIIIAGAIAATFSGLMASLVYFMYVCTELPVIQGKYDSVMQRKK